MDYSAMRLTRRFAQGRPFGRSNPGVLSRRVPPCRKPFPRDVDRSYHFVLKLIDWVSYNFKRNTFATLADHRRHCPAKYCGTVEGL
jgi:hypothetical protein